MDAWRALEAGRWTEARAAFEAADATPDALEGLGLALWFEGRVAEGVAAREQAFEAYARAGSCDDAARIAVWVSHQHAIAGRASAARGWLARAARAAATAGDGPGAGWVSVERARHADTVDACLAHARDALAVAQRTGAGDLEVFALSVLGGAEVRAGRRERGLELLEEAMAAATAGRVRNLHTLAEAYCNLIVACTAAGEWPLAAEWCEVVDDFATRNHTTPLLGACRTVHADVLLAAGRWADAEHALQSALAAVDRSRVGALEAPAVATLAELRVRQGRLGEAEQLLVGREEHPASLRALAHLRLAQHEPDVATALLERGLRATEGDLVRTMQLLGPLVDARLAAGDMAAADLAATRLAAAARESGMEPFGARADVARARVALARGRAADAAEPARRALAAFGRLGMPYEAAQARLELARAAPETAREEAHAALAVFRGLSASRGMDRAAAVLRDLGEGTAARARTQGELTARELQVLDLVALGMSNARIAQALVITEKTAAHHVSRILSKLGARNRAEAAAFATRAAIGSR